MILELVIALALGILCGCISGLIPGIHINLVSAFLISISSFLLIYTSPISLIVFIVSMSITHIFIDFIPSIFLGAPDDSALSVLPGHEMLLEGNGHEAIVYSIIGCLSAIPLLIILTPIFIILLPTIFFYLKFVMFLILLTVSIYMIYNDSNKKLSLFIFLLSGFLGIASLNLSLKESLLPLLSGLFGSSSLIVSIMKKQQIPKQEIKPLRQIKINKQEIKKSTLSSLISSPLCSFLPALGSSQAAIIGSNLTGKLKPKEFLMILGSVNLLVLSLSFITLFAIQESRSGSAVAIEKISSSLTLSSLVVIILVIVLSSIISAILSLNLSKFFSKQINRINYSKVSVITLIILSIIVLLFSGFLGFIVFLVSTFTGLVAILLGARRTNLMGCLMLPSILLYLPI